MKLYEDQVAGINSDMGFMIKVMGLQGLTGTYFPWYLIIDGDNVTLQGYDYFWDSDDRFQSVFRDRMGGNHQWLFNWYNLGGRSELADIVEVSCSPAGRPLMKFFWETNNLIGHPSQTSRGRSHDLLGFFLWRPHSIIKFQLSGLRSFVNIFDPSS